MTRVMEELAIEALDLRFAPLRLVVPAELARLKMQVEREGIRQPVLAATEVEADKRVLVDGFKRVHVARELGLARLAVTLLALDTPTALAAMLRSNLPRRGPTALEEGWIVRKLCRELGFTQEKAGALVGHDQSWVCVRLRLVEQLEAALQEDLRLGLVAPAVARQLGRLPRGQQLRAAQVVREQGLSSRQATELVSVLLATHDPRVQKDVLADPLGTLAAAHVAVPRKDPRLSAGGNELRRSLLAWEGAASRLAKIVLTHAPAGLAAKEERLLAPLLGQALAAGRRTLARLESLVGEPPEGADVSP